MTGKRKKRFQMKLLSVLLAVSLLAGTISTSAFAAAAADVTTETTGTINEVTEKTREESSDDAAQVLEEESAAQGEENAGEPDKTEAPTDPETPEKPAAPEDPETPEKPAVPETPKEPETPGNPETPGEVTDPETSETPVEPIAPENPEMPEEPSDLENPETPAEPETPEEPKESDTSDTPETVTGTVATEEAEQADTIEAVKPEEEQIPEEVQVFLDAVAVLPDVSEITPTNAKEIGDQVNAVLDLWDAMDEKFSARKDVEAALDIVYDVYAAVLEAVEVGTSETYDRSDSMFGKTLTINESTYGNYAEETITATISVGVGETVIDEGTLQFWNTRYGTYRVTNWIWFNVIVGDPTVLSVEKEISGANVKLIFKGLKDGSTTVTLDYGASLVSIGDTIWGAGNVGSVTGAGYYSDVQIGTGGPVKPAKKPVVNSETKVYFKCTSYPDSDPESRYNDTHALWDQLANLNGYYSLSEILPNDGTDPRAPADDSPWMCILTLDAEKCAQLYNQYRQFFDNKTHYLASPSEKVTLRYYYDHEWYSFRQDAPLVIWMSEEQATSYMVSREYIKDGVVVKTVADITKYDGNVGDKVEGKTLADANPDWAICDEVTYTYKSCNPSPLRSEEHTSELQSQR